MSVFSEWQPRYAGRGIATFPVSQEKRPTISHWQRVGIKGSERLVIRFPEADAFGFQCGPHSGVTILDIDSQDAGVLDEAIRVYGRSPVLWRTQSGNFAMPFRHSGEGRKIKRPDADIPIDILGGGYAVAPPSVGAKGRYEFIEGELSDFDRLPRLNIPAPVAERIEPQPMSAETGRRNNDLWRFAMSQARYAGTFEDLLGVAHTRNNEFPVPLSDEEVMRLAASAWGYEERGENLIGRGGSLIVPNSATRVLLDLRDGNAALLFMALRHQYKPNAIFPLAKSRAKALGIHRTTLARARDLLEDAGLIERVHQGGGGPHDPHLFRWTALARGRSG